MPAAGKQSTALTYSLSSPLLTTQANSSFRCSGVSLSHRICGRYQDPMMLQGWERFDRLERHPELNPSQGKYSLNFHAAGLTFVDTLCMIILKVVTLIACGLLKTQILMSIIYQICIY